MTACQVVYAENDDRIQDDNLTKNDNFLFGKRGTEELPTSAVDIALIVRDIFVNLFFDGRHFFRPICYY